MRRTVFLIASVLVSALFLWLALRDVPLTEVVESIRQANVLWIVAALLFIAAGLWTRAVRWRGLLGFKIPPVEAFHIVNITFLANLLPLRAGEVARSLLATRSGVPVMTAATSIVVERLLDTLLVVVALSIAFSQLPSIPEAATRAAALFGIASVAAFATLIFFARYPQVAHRLLDGMERLLPFFKRLPLRRLLDNILDGLKPLTQWRSAAHAIGWTLISWTFSLLTFYALELALGINDPAQRLMTAVLGVGLASFSIAIPVSIGSIGPFEAAVRVAGEAVQMSPVLATSLGFLFHGTTILGYAIYGTIGLLAMGVSLSEMVGSRPSAEPSAASHSSQLSAKE
jgi:uncharacterized protein (TIRG00374 family)